MGDILDEASSVVQCRQCPWYKTCVSPMRINMEELSGQLQRNLAMDESNMPKFLSELAFASQNLLLESCPVFIKRLKDSPKLAERIKKIMQSWGTEEAETL